MITDELRAEYNELPESMATEAWANHFKVNPFDLIREGMLFIKTDRLEIIRLVPNNVQMILLNYIEDKWMKNKPCYIVVPKARRTGISTIIEAIMYGLCSQKENTSAIVIANKFDNSANLFEMSKLYQEKLLTDFRPNIQRSNVKELSFAGTHSLMKIDTAKTKNVGQSWAFQMIHLCLDENQEILVDDGRLKKMKDVAINDKVITHNGNSSEVSFISSKQHKSDMLEISFMYHNDTLTLTKEHKIITKDGWKQAVDLIVGDMISIPIRKIKEEIISKKVVEYEQHSTGKKIYPIKWIDLTEDFGYIVGYYLADGCIIHQWKFKTPSSINFTYNKDDKYINRVKKYFIENHSLKGSDRSSKDSRSKHTTFYSAVFTAMIEELFGAKNDKHIPDWVFNSSKSFINGLIKGYFHGDGSKGMAKKQKYESATIAITSVRESLIYQMRDLLLSMDIGFGSIRTKTAGEHYGRNCKKAWIYHINGIAANKLRKLLGYPVTKAKRNRQLAAQKYYIKDNKVWFPIKDIKKVSGRKVYDLEIKHKDHSFRTNICSVSNSEVAYFDNADSITTGLFQTLPDNMFTLVVLESTGNGIGGYFHDKVVGSKNGSNDYKLFFFAWYQKKENTMEIDSPETFELLNDGKFGDEVTIKKKYKLIDEQMNWRRYTIKNKCNNNLKTFAQEHPSNLDECFQAAGVNVFNIEKLNAIELDARPHRWQGILSEDEDGKVIFEENVNGWLKIWEKPDLTWDYLYNLSLDTGGIWEQTEKNCADWSSGIVRSRLKRMDVAQFHLHAPAHTIADRSILLAKYYGGCMIVPEINKWQNEIDDQGEAVVKYLKDRYSSLYYRKTYDAKNDEWKKQMGFHTNKATRKMLIEKGQEYVDNYNELGENLNDIEIVREFKMFVTNGETGKYEATKGEKDDRVMSWLINLFTSEELPLPVKKQKIRHDYSSADPGLL